MSSTGPGVITEMLARIRQGDRAAERELAELVYPLLKQIAGRLMRNERRGVTMRTSDLLHDAFMRLFPLSKNEWKNREHFLSVAARMMRYILVDHARKEYKGGRVRIPLDETTCLVGSANEDLVAVSEALARFEAIDPVRAQVVELRYFGGYTLEEVADVMGVSVATVKRYWETARAFLRSQLAAADTAVLPSTDT